MRGKSLLALCVCIVSAGAASALDFNLTVPMLQARPGSWIRRYAPNGHAHTQMVVAVDGKSVTLRLLRHHDGHVVDDSTQTFSAEYIREHGADPESPEARRETVEHKGRMYAVAVVDVELAGGPASFYISDAVPAGGLLRIDLPSPSGKRATTLWTDSYGTEPDDLILGESK